MMDEDNIWNYKNTASGSTGGGRRSKRLKSKPEKKKETLCSLEQNDLVIDVDLEEDFSFTSLKPVSNEQSTKQWAALFMKKEGKNITSETPVKKNSFSQLPRRMSSSKSSLKSNTKLKRKSDSPKSKKQIKSETDSKCEYFNNYLSPSKTSPKKRKVSGSVELSSSFSKDTDERIESVDVESNGDEITLSGKENDYDNSEESGVQTEIYQQESGIVNDEGITEDGDLPDLDFKDEPKVVDVVVIGDEDHGSLAANNTYSLECVSSSDTDLCENDSESAGGFMKNEDKSDLECKNKNEQHHFSVSPLAFSKVTSCDKSSVLPISFPSTSKGNSKCDDDSSLSVPVPRKQTSLFSFFTSKSSKPNNSTVQGLADKTNSFTTKGPRKGSYSYRREQSMPSNNISGIPGKLSAVKSNDNKNKPYQGRQRQSCPFYKKIPDTNITVDAFRYGVIPGCNVYFLTHFHYDHYGGLTKKFCQPIYCSEVTGNLVESRLGVAKQWINPLPLWKPVMVDGVRLTLMEANHCPGAVIIMFETSNGKKILHTGDFRASIEMEEYPGLQNVVVDELYLDTTYCNPSYAFPSQKMVIDFTLSLVEKQIALNPQTLIVCGAYTIGKERIFSAIAQRLDSKICVMLDKKKVLDCLDDDELKKRLTLNWSEGRVHVLPMGKLKPETLSDHHSRHSRFTSILAFEPTGWTHSAKSVSLENLKPKWSRNGITLYGVPYSEHSSYLEMKRFVQFIRPKKILPTVNNGNAAARQKMEKTFKQWLSEKTCDDKGESFQQLKMEDWMGT